MPLEQLRRPPNAAQTRCLSYLEKLVRTFGSVEDGTLPSETCRRMNSIVARLGELSSRLTSLGSLGDPYSSVPEGLHVPPSTVDESLDPYRSLDTSRLRIVGRGHWDPAPYLPADLAMAFAEPRSLLVDRIPDPSEFPRPDWESPSECLHLALKWADNNLLHLEPDVFLPLHCYTKIFNARKSSTVDRQIGDRRGPNAVEGRLTGLCSLSLDPLRHGLAICISDRRDFYHQLSVPPERAVTNRLFPYSGVRLHMTSCANASKSLKEGAMKQGTFLARLVALA